MSRTAVFIDAGYWSRVIADHFDGAMIDFRKLPGVLAGGNAVLRTHWYDCLPWVPGSPNPEESRRFQRKQKFLQYLSNLEGWTVREGKLRPRYIRLRGRVNPPTTYDGLPVLEKSRGQKSQQDTHYLFDFVQKGVDVLIALDMVTLADTGNISDIALVTADNDLVAPLEEIKRSRGVSVTLWYYPSTPLDDLKRAADQRCEITKEFVDSVRREQPR